MISLSNATETASCMLESGQVKDVAEANVMIVRLMGVRIIDSPLPRDVRSALSAAVKDGRLGRLPKKGPLPEAFFHPNGRSNAIADRERFARDALEAQRTALAGVMVHHSEIAR
jgi:hypothetical protein